MKKIFTSLFAVAALVGCSTDLTDEIAPSTPAQTPAVTVPLEINLGEGESRLYDENLKWSWADTDLIYGTNVIVTPAVNTPNIGTHQALENFGNGKFGLAEFALASGADEDQAAAFVFSYMGQNPNNTVEMDFLTDWAVQKYRLVIDPAQSGVWDPVMIGAAYGTTAAGLAEQTINMVPVTAALELRIHSSDRSTRVKVSDVELASEAALFPTEVTVKFSVDTEVGLINGLTTDVTKSANSLVVEPAEPTEVVVVNILPGTHSFELTLTDMTGNVTVVDVPSKEFVAGARTVLNVEWNANVTSWYNEFAKDGEAIGFEAGHIYVDGYSKVLVNGQWMDVNNGKIAVAPGRYTVQSSENSKEYSVVVVSAIPTTATAAPTFVATSSYNNSNGVVNKNNKLAGNLVNLSEVSYNAPAADKALFGKPQIVCVADELKTDGSQLAFTTMGEKVLQMFLPVGDKGYGITFTTEKSVIVTGIPYKLDPADNDGTWQEEKNIWWESEWEGPGVKIGKALFCSNDSLNTGESYLEKTFYLPKDTAVSVAAKGYAYGYASFEVITRDYKTTYTCYVSGTEVDSYTAEGSGSLLSGYKSKTTPFDFTKNTTMTAAAPTIKHHNSNSTANSCTVIETFTVLYQ